MDLNLYSDWLELARPNVVLGRVRVALFDFDGTLSVIRRGWEKIMIALMVEALDPATEQRAALEAEVAAYVDRSTGILTIRQMQWLEAAVRSGPHADRALSAGQYKRIYNERLLQPVRARLAQLGPGSAARDEWMIAGARDFLARLAARGVPLFLASGTDQEYVQAEAAELGVTDFFAGRISGARGESTADSKEVVIQRILDEHRLSGPELLVVGDGPVEIEFARRVGAVALGLASDEERRAGLNPRKRQRLLSAGADLITGDFSHAEQLVELLVAS